MTKRVGVRELAACLVLVTGPVFSACGNVTAGGFGEAVVVVSGDAPDSTFIPTPTPAAVAAARSAPGTDWARSDTDDDDDEQPEGELEAELLLFLVRPDGTEEALSDQAVEIEVDLEGVEEDETLPRVVPADVYSALRVVFLEIEVEVDAGLVIDGVPVLGPIEIESDDVIEVSKPLALDVVDDASVEIFVDLNASEWLRSVDPATASVDASVFLDLISVSIR